MSAYSASEATEYDTRSAFDKGDRTQHRDYIADVVRHLKPDLARFVDLGCGTGFFAEALLDAAPQAQALLVDGSEPMLERARRRLTAAADRVTYRAQEVAAMRYDPPWDRVDLILSSLTLHFVPPEVRAEALRQAFAALADGGLLILVDHFVPRSARHAGLLEYLACRDVQRRMHTFFGPAFAASRDMQIDEIIRRDREREAAEGAAHLDVEEIRSMVAAAGFRDAGILFQDARFFGLVAHKGGGE
jgi:SAM-dependent methyltransferase